jgi:hypothetical protein
MASEGLGTVKGFAARPSITAWLLYGGFVIAAIAMFFPWVTVSADIPLAGHLSDDVSPFKGFWILAVLLVIAGAAWLAWPTVSGSQMSVNRLMGLTAVIGLLTVGLFIGFATYANGVSQRDSELGGRHIAEFKNLVDVSVGPGLLLYTAAVVAIVVGVVHLWIDRSRVQKQAH